MDSTHTTPATSISDQGLDAHAGRGDEAAVLPVLAWYDTNGSGHPATQAEMLAALPFAIYPGAAYPHYESPMAGTATGRSYEADRPTYQQFMPIFDTLDAAGWNPITAATSSDSTQILERFGPDSSGAIYYVLRNPNSTASTVSVTVGARTWVGRAART